MTSTPDTQHLPSGEWARRDDGAWEHAAPASVGPSGRAGVKGSTGAQGPQGVAGPQGTAGAVASWGPWRGDWEYIANVSGYGGPFATVTFRVNSVGDVQLRGLLTVTVSMNSGVEFLRVPAPYGPPGTLLQPAYSQGQACRLDISNVFGAARIVWIGIGLAGSSVAAGSWIGLDGIEWSTSA